MYKLLIVEDEKLIRQRLIYGIDFEKLNCVVIGEARDGKEGSELIQSMTPDIVLTDINMPIMNAFDMFEETIKCNYSAIILSGFNEFSNAQKAIKYGVTEFIVKPFREQDICEAIKRAIVQVDHQNYFLKLRQTDRVKDKAILTDSLSGIEDEVVLEMIEYVKHNYWKKFVFNDVSKEIGYSSTLLHEKFKKETQTTFNDYLNRYRINKSIQMLKNEDKKVYDIAEECGFSEYKYYNKVFKKYVGVSTTEFIEKL
ncbi:response regulator [Alkalibacterium psychrotolerans]